MKEFDIQKDNTHDNDIVSKSQDGLYAFNPESPHILWSTSKSVHYHIFLFHLHAFHQAKVNPMAALFPSTPCAVLHVNLQLLPFASRIHLYFLPLHVPLLYDKIRQ